MFGILLLFYHFTLPAYVCIFPHLLLASIGLGMVLTRRKYISVFQNQLSQHVFLLFWCFPTSSWLAPEN